MAEGISLEDKMRIIQEIVPGKQVTLAHIIASPDPILYKKLGLDPSLDYEREAIGITTVTPSETAVIMADVGIKSSAVSIGFVDRFSGTLIFTGDVADVETAMEAMTGYVRDRLGHTVCEITKT